MSTSLYFQIIFLSEVNKLWSISIEYCSHWIIHNLKSHFLVHINISTCHIVFIITWFCPSFIITIYILICLLFFIIHIVLYITFLFSWRLEKSVVINNSGIGTAKFCLDTFSWETSECGQVFLFLVCDCCMKKPVKALEHIYGLTIWTLRFESFILHNFSSCGWTSQPQTWTTKPGECSLF